MPGTKSALGPVEFDTTYNQAMQREMGSAMPERDQDQVRYLREKAAQFRALAKAYDTPLSSDLLKIAGDLEQRAADIEARLR